MKILLAAVALLPITGRADPVFISIDAPGAFRTAAFAVNSDGAVVGDYALTHSESQGGGYLWQDGIFTAIDFPGSHFTRPMGINDAGEIVGWFLIDGNKQHGFFRSTDGRFSVIDVPGAVFTSLNGIDDDGNIVGNYCLETNSEKTCSSGVVHAFLLSGGTFSVIDPPGAIYVEAWSSNGAQVVGRYAGADGQFHLYLYSISDGSYVYPPPDPVAVETAAEWWSFQGGIDGAGEFVSNYCSAQPCGVRNSPVEWDFASGVVHGFLYSSGDFISVDLPGSIATVAFGIDLTGEWITGTWFTSGLNGGEHGYVLIRDSLPAVQKIR
jgi:hypothetical protein